jgi:hypothetical protein
MQRQSAPWSANQIELYNSQVARFLLSIMTNKSFFILDALTCFGVKEVKRNHWAITFCFFFPSDAS